MTTTVKHPDIKRTAEEISAEIVALESVATRVRPYDVFGEDNAQKVYAQIEVLVAQRDLTAYGEKYAYPEFSDEEDEEDDWYPDYICESAEYAWDWLVGNEDVLAEDWELICRPVDKSETGEVTSNTMKAIKPTKLTAQTASEAINLWIARHPEDTNAGLAAAYSNGILKVESPDLYLFFPTLTADAVRNRRRRMAGKLTEAETDSTTLVDQTPPVSAKAESTDAELLKPAEEVKSVGFTQTNGVSFAMAQINGTIVIVANDNPYWEDAYQAYQSKNWEEFLRISKPAARKVTLSDRVSFTEDGNLVVDGKVFDASMADTFLAYIRAGAPLSRLVAFTERLANNPYDAVKKTLFSFLEHGNLPITEDGHFIAYKYVKDDYGDYHTNGTKDYTPGKEVLESDLDTNPHNSCSKGLHAGTEKFVNGWGHKRRILLLVDPADVVCVPYGETYKIRCKRVVSIGDWEGTPLKESIYRVEGNQVTPVKYEFS